VDSLEEDDETDAKVVEDVEFDNLSIVPTGAAPSNTLEMGEHAELSVAALRQFTGSLNRAELQEIEPGMWVQSNGTKGITISQVQDGEIEVDIYEESDGKWRSTGETEMFDTDSLEEWDVDEEEDIGTPEDEEEDEDDSESESEENAELVATDDKVQWDDGSAQGVVVERKEDGCFNERIDGDVEVCAGEDEAVVLIEIVKDGERNDTMVAHKEGTLNEGDFELAAVERGDEPRSDEGDMSGPDAIDAPDLSEGQMVQWNVNPKMKGKIVHIPDDEPIVMIEVFEEEDGELVTTNETISAGHGDVEPVDDMEDAGVTSKDVPSDSAEPTHDTPEGRSLMDMFKAFFSRLDEDDASLEDFQTYLVEEEELADFERGESEEEPLDSEQDLEDSREKDSRWLDSEIEELEETFDDYPEAASENAQMALDAREETDNPNDCGTDTGWTRANQLASEESLSAEVVSKMAQFNRHRSNSEMDDEEGRADCGWMMWKAWGGDEGVDWAKRKMDTIEEELALADVPDKHLFTSREDAVSEAEDLDGVSGVHELDGMWIPGDTHEEYMNNILDKEIDEDANESDKEEELQEYEFHNPDWDGTTESDWSTPDLEDFDTDDLSEVADHFLISTTGFPPENFTDLKLPVVEPNGDLNVNALSAVKGGRGVSAVDGLPEEKEEDIVDWVNETANSEFDRDWGMEENMKVPEDHRFESEEDAMEKAKELELDGVHEMEFDGETMYVPGSSHEEYLDVVSSNSKHGDEMSEHDIDGTSGRPTASKTVGGVTVLSGDDLQQGSKSEESDVDELTTIITTMTSDIEEKLSELDDPVAVEATEVEELRDKADRFEEMSENLEALRERTDILDEVDRSQVEELAEADDPVVKESTRYEELQSEAEQVAGVYAAQLAEEYPAFSAEELTDKFGIEELREKFEEEIGSVEEELTSSESAEPKSQDADEESLEGAAEEEDADEAELSEDVAAKQEEIRQKILGGD
jgi:hypothetical protein